MNRHGQNEAEVILEQANFTGFENMTDKELDQMLMEVIKKHTEYYITLGKIREDIAEQTHLRLQQLSNDRIELSNLWLKIEAEQARRIAPRQ